MAPSDSSVVQATVVVGGDRWPTFLFQQPTDSTAVVAGLTQTGSSSSSGALECQVEGRPRIENCLITGNATLGIHLRDAAPIIVRCEISNKSASYGGGIRCHRSSPRLVGCTIQGNQSADFGGGAYVDSGSEPLFLDCLIQENSAVDGGGGLYFETADPLEDGFNQTHPDWPTGYNNGIRADMGAFGGPGNSGWLPWLLF
jgi:hypothetical protein